MDSRLLVGASGRRGGDRGHAERHKHGADEELPQQQHDPRARVASQPCASHSSPTSTGTTSPSGRRSRTSSGSALRRSSASATSCRAAASRRRRSTGSPPSAARRCSETRTRSCSRFPDDSPEPVTERQLEVRDWTLSQLDPRTSSRSAPSRRSCTASSTACRSLLFHGSPRSYDDVLLPELGGEALEPFLGHDAALLAGGHTHLQWTRRIGDALYVNPGSVGISYDRHPDPPVLRAARRVGARHRRGRCRRRRVPPGARTRSRTSSRSGAERPAVRRRVAVAQLDGVASSRP